MGEVGVLPEIGLGALTRWCGPELVDRAIDKCGRREQWVRLLPARTMVYFELARCLFPGEGYAHVYEHLLPLPGDIAPGQAAGGMRVPNKSSLCKARAKLGPEVLEALFREVAGGLADPQRCPSAFWRGLRLLAFDGTTLTVADGGENTAAFGRCGPPGAQSGYPLARIVPLVECGTRALAGVAVGGWKEGEERLARQLAASAGPGTLVLADAGFPGVVLWHAFRAAGAELLWRLPANVAARVEREFEDGSYLSRMSLAPLTRAERARYRGEVPQHAVMRVIEYRVDGGAELYRLGTTMLDPGAAPAAELAPLYQQRWESEGQLKETKATQLGEARVLASRSPDGIRQEIWAHLIVCQATRSLIQQAATGADPPLDPGQVSFKHAQILARMDLRPGLSPL